MSARAHSPHPQGRRQSLHGQVPLSAARSVAVEYRHTVVLEYAAALEAVGNLAAAEADAAAEAAQQAGRPLSSAEVERRVPN